MTKLSVLWLERVHVTYLVRRNQHIAVRIKHQFTMNGRLYPATRQHFLDPNHIALILHAGIQLHP